MKKRSNWKIAAITAACSLILGGCNLFTSPESLIQLPKQAQVFNQSEDMLSIAKRNLPKGTEFSVPNGPVGVDPVIGVDLNGDGKEEALVLYRSVINQNQVGAFVLKSGKKGWGKVFAKKGTGSVISWASVSDVTGDGKMEILLGWQSGGSAEKVLEIYKWRNDKLTLLKALNYHELEALRFENDQMTRLAVWRRDMADAYNIDLLAWNGESFVADKIHYPSYFQKVIAYYEQRTSEVPNAAYYWYYLADAHLKANHPEQAIEAINKGMELKSVVPTKDFFQKLKLQAENMLAEPNTTIVENQKYTNLEEELVIQKVKEAARKYWYVTSGGKMPEGKVKTVTINNNEYRYLGTDLNTYAKMLGFLSDSFTINAIESFLRRAQIFEYFERLIQPNADGGSILNYEKSEVVQKKDRGNEKEFDIKVPVDHSSSFEFVHISFQKADNGWRIFSEPGSF